MAALTASEFEQAVGALVEHYGLGRTRDRLVSLGAFQQRRGLNSPAALADRLFRLSGGLRLQTRTTIAFSALWSEMLRARLGEETERELEALADKVNACLGPKDTIVPGREAELDAALAEYHARLASHVGPEVARCDMLLKAVPAVAERLRTTSNG
jgi:hypothetical protein